MSFFSRSLSESAYHWSSKFLRYLNKQLQKEVLEYSLYLSWQDCLALQVFTQWTKGNCLREDNNNSNNNNDNNNKISVKVAEKLSKYN